MGCPGLKLAHSSKCLTHHPSSKVSTSNVMNTAVDNSVCKKFSVRYVYSSECNPGAIESLLAKEKAIVMIKCKSNDSENSYTRMH